MIRLDHRDAMPEGLRGAVIALGNFDGFHLGHQAVVREAVEWARAENRPAIVATFDPHPVRHFAPHVPPFRLTGLDQRQELFAAAGAEAMLVFHFDAALAETTAEDFVRGLLGQHLGASGVVTGEDFTFGKGRGGNLALLRQVGAEAGIAARAVGPVMDGGRPVSSSRIRDALKAGECEEAARLMTRPFAIRGEVIHGDKRGREIGYPTANMELGAYLRPRFGIYAVTGRLPDGTELKGAANVGVRPMFDPPKELLEPYFFDFAGELYGQEIEVALHHFLRPEEKFDGLAALQAQMAQDCERARAAGGLKNDFPTRADFASAPQHMSEAPDYRPTVFLPKTDFPMKAGLPAKEPGIAARWESEGLYKRIREARAGREKFILHDGPPYANGDMHIGHALNHVLKDMVVRTQTLLGKDAPYVPGWDCHGLPIEWKVEEQYRKKKLDKDQVPAKEFRAECRAYAAHWVDVQREQLKRLGIGGDWDNPYLTMQFDSEATIVAELLKFAESGQLYRGAKPVMWSPVEKTALAEAEVEYEDIVSTQIDVAFEIVESPIPKLVGAHAVIWTTTPWTIPVNQALAYGPEVEYSLLAATDGRKYLVACDLVEPFLKRTGLGHLDEPNMPEGAEGLFRHGLSKTFKGSELAGTMARHPMARLFSQPGLVPGQGFSSSAAAPEGSTAPEQVRGDKEGVAGSREWDAAEWERAKEFFLRPRPFLPGEFVTTDSGTGLVHMAPDHGEDDFELCKAHGLNPKFVVEGDGRYREDWAWLGRSDPRNMSVINPKFNAPDGPVCEDLRAAGALLAASADYQHSYPHSWRSKAKVIFRCTPQWFVPMDREITPPPPPAVPLPDRAGEDPGSSPSPDGEGDQPQAGGGVPSTLRQTALAAIADTRFVPAKGRNRIGSMVEGRPDWVLSRQRAWGVPITLFVHRESGEYLVDSEVNARIVAAVRERGVDAWDEECAQALLGDKYDLADYERVTDILDVWFDSGSTHAFVLESGRWPELQWPADLYLEGSDQHRGWFQSSLLESCATRGRAPYEAVLTHGFTMASDGRKMSKSLGNTVDPNKVMETYGADIIRLWALSVDYTEDHRIGDEILKGVADQYRKLRNTFRYLLGALDGFEESERVGVEDMPELERYVLALLGELDATLRKAVADFDFNTYVRALSDFANEDLSAFFFDIRKDRLYCDAPDDPRRRAYRTTLDILFQALVRYAAPVLVFTTEEVWDTRYPDAESVHLLEWPDVPKADADMARWDKLRALRERVTEAIEPLRREKIVRSGLEASVTVPADAVPEGFTDEDLAELFISGPVTRGDSLAAARTEDAKCGRCWRLLPEVPEDGALCGRCAEVVETMDATT